MIRIAVADLRARPARLLATALAVALGVAFVAAVFVLVDTVRGAFDHRFIDGGRHAAGVVRPVGGLETQRYTRIPDRVADSVTDVPGVGAVAAVHQETVLLTGPGGEKLDRRAETSRLDRAGLYLGNWIDQPELRDQELRLGHRPAASGEVAVHQHSATTHGLKVGDRVRVVLPYTAFAATVTGIFDYGDQDPAPNSPLFAPAVVVSTQMAAEQLGDPRELRVLAATGTNGEELRAAVAQVLSDGRYEIVSAAAVARDTFEVIWRQNLGPLATGMLIFAGISVLAAGLIVFTTFTITVAQRTRQYALLRTLGAGRGQVTAAVSAEALTIGLAAGAAGVLLGLGLAAGLRLLLAATGIDLLIGATDPLVLHPRTVLVALLTGTVAAVLAALIPAVRASRVPPLQALREPVQTPRPTAGRRLARAGLLVLAASIAILVVSLRGLDGTEEAVAERLLPLGAAAVGVFLAMALLAPRCTAPVAQLIGAPAAALRGLPAQLARANATRNPGRTALTATALLLGVGLVSFTLVVTASLDATQQSRIREITFTDFWIRADGLSSFPGEASEAVAAVDGVEVASAVRPAQLSIAGTPSHALAVQPQTFMQVVDVPVRAGDFAALSQDAGTGPARVALATDLAADLGVRVGDTLPVTFIGSGAGAGELGTRVVATYDPDRLPEGFGTTILISRDRAAAVDPLHGDTTALVDLDEGRTVEQTRPALQAALRGFPVVLQDAEEARTSMSGRISSVLSLGLGLLLLTVVIAVFGIANTLTLSVTERTRELGLLRAVGLSRAQARSMIRWEALIVTLLGTLLGVALGVFFAWMTALAVPNEIAVFAIPGTWLTLTVAAGAVAAMLAAAIPAHRASRVEIIRAITQE